MTRPASLALCTTALFMILGPSPARAQPAPTAPNADSPAKLRAKALNAAAVQQSKAGNKAAALGLFEDAYREFPTPSLLFNIATTQGELGQLVEAAATFERFLADPAPPPDRIEPARAALAQLAAQLARVEFAITAPSTVGSIEVAVDDGPWSPPTDRYLMPGPHVVHARGVGSRGPVDVPIEGVAGAVVTATIALAVEVAKEPQRQVDAAPEPPDSKVERGPTAVPRSPGRFGALLAVAVDPASSGVTGLVAATYAAHPRVQVNLGGMLGGNRAGFVTATAALLPGRLRPTATVGGVLAFYSWSGADHGTLGMVERTLIGLHGAVGVEWWPGARLGVLAEAVAEYYPTGEPDIHPLVFTPTVGVRGRL